MGATSRSTGSRRNRVPCSAEGYVKVQYFPAILQAEAREYDGSIFSFLVYGCVEMCAVRPVTCAIEIPSGRPQGLQTYPL